MAKRDVPVGRGQLDRPERLLFNFIATSPELEPKWRKRMDWVLFVVIVSTSITDKAINSSTVPMATQQLCDAAKAQLIQAYKETQSPNFVLYAECLQAR
jgi:hypothetical protein